MRVRVVSNGRKERDGVTTPPPPPPPPPPSGGSRVSSDPIVIQNTSSDITISGFNFQGGGINDNRIAIQLRNCTGKIVIDDVGIYDFAGLDSRGIRMDNCRDVRVLDLDFKGNTCDFQGWNSVMNNFYFIGNRCKGRIGNRNDGSILYPGVTGGLTSFAQLVNCTVTNFFVLDNREWFEGDQDGIELHDNFNWLNVKVINQGEFGRNWAKSKVLSRNANNEISTNIVGNPWQQGGAYCVFEQGSTNVRCFQNIVVNTCGYGFQVVHNHQSLRSSGIILNDNIVINEKRSEFPIKPRTGVALLTQPNVSYQLDAGAIQDMNRNVGITWRAQSANAPWNFIRNDVYQNQPGISDKSSNLYGAAAEAAGYNANVIPDYFI